MASTTRATDLTSGEILEGLEGLHEPDLEEAKRESTGAATTLVLGLILFVDLAIGFALGVFLRTLLP